MKLINHWNKRIRELEEEGHLSSIILPIYGKVVSVSGLFLYSDAIRQSVTPDRKNFFNIHFLNKGIF